MDPPYGQAKAGRPARTYIQQLREDTGCSPEDLPKAMNDREKWRERVRDIPTSGTTWWWWWWLPAHWLVGWVFANGPSTQSYQRFKKWYLMPTCLILSIIGCRSRVRWSNPGKRVAPFPTPRCSSYLKGSLRLPLDYDRQICVRLRLSSSSMCADSWIPWLYFTIRPYQPSYLVSRLDINQCPFKANECKISLVSQRWCVHTKASLMRSSLLR